MTGSITGDDVQGSKEEGQAWLRLVGRRGADGTSGMGLKDDSLVHWSLCAPMGLP